MSPETTEGAAATAPSTVSPSEKRTRRIYPSRNAHKREAVQRRAAFDSLGAPSESVHGSEPRSGSGGGRVAGAGSLLLAAGTTPREAWITWLAPVFADNGSCYFTGTYSDDYGVPNGLMAQRNVFKDFTRFLESFGWGGQYIVAVEKHAWRDVLHLHAILQGPMTDEQRAWIKTAWACDRGHARALPVLDGCASYVTKYALKHDSDSFDWRLS